MTRDAYRTPPHQKTFEGFDVGSCGAAGNADWRPIHYIGSKLRLLPEIRAYAGELCRPGGRICDLFAGSGTVSLALGRDYPVLAADIQFYSAVLCSALLAPPLPPEEVAALLARAADRMAAARETLTPMLEPLLEYEAVAADQSDQKPDRMASISMCGQLLRDRTGTPASLLEAKVECRRRMAREAAGGLLTTTRYYGGVYFSYRQALELDCISAAAADLPEHRTVLTAAAISTASDLVNSVGRQFAQPLKPVTTGGRIKPATVRQMVRDRRRRTDVAAIAWMERYARGSCGPGHEVRCGDYREVLPSLPADTGLIYADPPYTRDHYSRFYHVLETIARGDQPRLSEVRGAGQFGRGLYRTDRHQSPFCIKSRAAGAFHELFAAAAAAEVPVLASYSGYADGGHPRLMTIPEIQGIAERFYRTVDVRSSGAISRGLMNRADRRLTRPAVAEIFFLCRGPVPRR